MKYQRLPVEVDPFRLVEQGRVLQGTLPVEDFPRLKELLYREDIESSAEIAEVASDVKVNTSDTKNTAKNTAIGVIEVRLEFTRNESELPIIKGEISCQLDLACQRCLEAVTTTVESTLSVVLVSSDAQAESLQQGYDTWQVENQRLFLQDFIEDEILLALPIVVSHEKCEPVRHLIEALPSEQNQVIYGTEKENPFSVLKKLKKKQ